MLRVLQYLDLYPLLEYLDGLHVQLLNCLDGDVLLRVLQSHDLPLVGQFDVPELAFADGLEYLVALIKLGLAFGDAPEH